MTTVSVSGHSWWYHFAVLGKSAGVAIGAAAGIGTIIPIPSVQAIAAIVGGVATVVTSYATKGVASEQ